MLNLQARNKDLTQFHLEGASLQTVSHADVIHFLDTGERTHCFT